MATRQLGLVLRQLHKLAISETTRDLSDGQLLQRFTIDGDQAAFATLVQRHGPLVLSVCRHVLSAEPDAEDAFQVTFLVLARNAASIRRKEAVASWLHGVAYRSALQIRRDTVRRRAHEKQAQSMPQQKYSGELACRELQAVLDEEVQR